jgi:arsenate reductase
MAEAFCRHYRGDVYDAYSAGVERHGLNPTAVRAMAEAGIDISDHRSKTLEELTGVGFDVVVTVCDRASESCPVVPGDGLHAQGATSDEEAFACYLSVRDEIERFVRDELDAAISAPATRQYG